MAVRRRVVAGRIPGVGTLKGGYVAETDSEAPSRSGALDRGLAILDHLATAREATVVEIANAVDLSRSTTYRLMDRLREAGFAEPADEAGLWRLGPAAARLATAAVQSNDVVHVAPDLLRLLVQQTRETVGLAVFNSGEMIFIYRERGPQPVTVSAQLGARRPLHCTSVGKAYLSALPDTEARALIRRLDLAEFTEHTITSRLQLEHEVAVTGRRGWSEDHREFDLRVTCCGAPILDRTGRPVAAISIAGPTERTEGTLHRLGPVVASTAEAISHRLGYQPR